MALHFENHLNYPSILRPWRNTRILDVCILDVFVNYKKPLSTSWCLSVSRLMDRHETLLLWFYENLSMQANFGLNRTELRDFTRRPTHIHSFNIRLSLLARIWWVSYHTCFKIRFCPRYITDPILPFPVSYTVTSFFVTFLSSLCLINLQSPIK